MVKWSIQQKNGTDILATTGASNTFCKQNIYDIAGNVTEWTLEYSNNSTNPCTFRGGEHFTSGELVPASRRDSGNTTYSTSVVGFRVTLY